MRVSHNFINEHLYKDDFSFETKRGSWGADQYWRLLAVSVQALSILS